MGNAAPTPESKRNFSGREDRVHARQEWENEVQVAWFKTEIGYLPEEPLILHAQNISAGRVALRSRCMVHRGQLGIILLGKRSGDALIRGVEVRHCAYDAKLKTHITGCGWAPIPSYLETRVRTDAHHGLILEVVMAPEADLEGLSDSRAAKKKSA